MKLGLDYLIVVVVSFVCYTACVTPDRQALQAVVLVKAGPDQQVRLDPKASKDPQARRVSKDQPDRKVSKDLQVPRASRAQLVRRVSKDQQDLRASRDLQVLRASKDQQALRASRDPQAHKV